MTVVVGVSLGVGGSHDEDDKVKNYCSSRKKVRGKRTRKGPRKRQDSEVKAPQNPKGSVEARGTQGRAGGKRFLVRCGGVMRKESCGAGSRRKANTFGLGMHPLGFGWYIRVSFG